MPNVSVPTQFLFYAIVVSVFITGVFAIYQAYGRERRAALWGVVGLAAWLGMGFVIAASEFLRDFTGRPPNFVFIVTGFTAATFSIAFSSIGSRLIERLPASRLIAYQSFRVPVEWFLWAMYLEGIVPIQMTFEGRNFDILSGLLAIGIAITVARTATLPRRIVLAWNILGLGLLINIVAIAILSTPSPLRMFMNEPANTFIAYPPYIWLPTFLVQAALFGHLLVFRLWWQK